MNIEIDSNRLKEFFRNNNVGLAYLFGSMAREPSTLSDIDIAIMLAPAEKDRYKKKLFFTIQMQKLFHRNEVDIGILNEAPPALRFNIIKAGKVIYAADESSRITFEAQTMCDYIDTKPLREEYTRRLFENIKEGHFHD